MGGGVNGQGQGRDIEDVNRFDVLQNIDREGQGQGQMETEVDQGHGNGNDGEGQVGAVGGQG